MMASPTTFADRSPAAPLRPGNRRNSDSGVFQWSLNGSAGSFGGTGRSTPAPSAPLMMSTSTFDLGAALKAAAGAPPYYRKVVYRPGTSLTLPGSTRDSYYNSLYNTPNGSGRNSVAFMPPNRSFRSVPGTPEAYYSTPREEMKQYKNGLIRPKTTMTLTRNEDSNAGLPTASGAAPSPAPPPLLAPLPATMYPAGMMSRKKFADRPRTQLRLGGDWHPARRNAEDFQAPPPPEVFQRAKPFLPRTETNFFFYDSSRF